MTGQRLFILGSFMLFAGCAETARAPSSGQGMSGHSSPSQMTAQSAPPRRSVSPDSVTLSILEARTGDLVIYAHGVVTTSNIFPKYQDTYSPAYRCIVADLRGYGDSEQTPTGSNISQYVKDLIPLADRL